MRPARMMNAAQNGQWPAIYALRLSGSNRLKKSTLAATYTSAKATRNTPAAQLVNLRMIGTRVTGSHVRRTLRVTCGTRRARALPQTVRGDVGRSRDSKARARPARQVHALVGRHLPAGQKSKLVKRGTAHRFSPSRYARVDRKESPAFVRLQRPHRA